MPETPRSIHQPEAEGLAVTRHALSDLVNEKTMRVGRSMASR